MEQGEIFMNKFSEERKTVRKYLLGNLDDRVNCAESRKS